MVNVQEEYLFKFWGHIIMYLYFFSILKYRIGTVFCQFIADVDEKIVDNV